MLRCYIVVRGYRTKVMVVAGVVACIGMFALGCKPQRQVTMSICGFVTNSWDFMRYDGISSNYVYAIIAVTNHVNGSFICWTENMRTRDRGDSFPYGFTPRSVAPRSSFTFETLPFGETNRVELMFTPLQKRWPFGFLPDTVLTALPRKLYTPKPFKVSTPEFYVAKDYL